MAFEILIQDHSRIRGSMRSPRWSASLILIGCLLPLIGCVRNEMIYEVTIRPTPDGFERSLVVWRQDTVTKPDDQEASKEVSLPTEEQALLEAIYGTGRIEGYRHQFRRQFGQQIPNDIGGAGVLICSQSSLGRSFHYQEGFRGHFTSRDERQAYHEAIDHFFDHVTQWLRFEWSNNDTVQPEAHAEQLVDTIDQTLRDDAHRLLNLLLVLRAAESFPSVDEQDVSGELLLSQFLLERGCLDGKQLVRLIGGTAQIGGEHALLDGLVSVLARKSGVPEQAEVLQQLRRWLEDGERFSAYLEQTPEYQQLLQAANDAGEEPPEVESVATQPLMEHLLPLLFTKSPNSVTIRLQTDHEPFATNGQWDPTTRAVVWVKRLPDRDAVGTFLLPKIVMAQWSIPDQAFQTRLFGAVEFNDNRLASYHVWLDRLDAPRQTQWNATLDQLAEATQAESRRQAFATLQGIVASADEVDAQATQFLDLISKQLP